MSAQNPDKIGPKKIGPKEFMKYVQYFLDQSPQTNNLPLGDYLGPTLNNNLPLGD